MARNGSQDESRASTQRGTSRPDNRKSEAVGGPLRDRRGTARSPDVYNVGNTWKSFTDVLRNSDRIYDGYKENQANKKIGNH